MGGFAEITEQIGQAVRFLAEGPGSGVATVFLSLVFGWSGATKLRRPSSAAMAMVGFGLTRRVRPRLGLVLGAVEAAVALALVFGGPLSPFALVISAAMLCTFTVLVARSLIAGDRFPCSCFGGAEHALSVWTLLRTGSLSILASVPAIAWATGNVQHGTGRSPALEISAAAALLGTVVLLANVRKLFEWNHQTSEALTRGSEGRQ